MCSALDQPLSVKILPTLEHGPVCVTVCPTCRDHSHQYLRASAKHFAAEHREHLTRARASS